MADFKDSNRMLAGAPTCVKSNTKEINVPINVPFAMWVDHEMAALMSMNLIPASEPQRWQAASTDE